MRPLEKQTTDLTIVDIDDCLFYTAAKVAVVDDRSGQVIAKLNSAQYARYRLNEGERFDYKEFRESKIFAEFSSPVEKMMNTSRVILELIRNKPRSQMILLTARSDFDDRDLFLDTFKRFQFDVSLTHVYRAGNLSSKAPTYENKRQVLRSLIELHRANGGEIDSIRFFDDGEKNLQAIYDESMALGVKSVSTYLVDSQGETSVWRQSANDDLFDVAKTIVESFDMYGPDNMDFVSIVQERLSCKDDVRSGPGPGNFGVAK